MPHDALGMPIIPLYEGPYEGLEARTADREHPVTFFRDRVVVYGDDGPAVYMLANKDGERVGKYAYMGTE